MAKLLPIVTHPDENLRKISKEIDSATFKNNAFKALVLDMIKTMREKDGVGLAAPQIGENIRLVVIFGDPEELVMINPKIIKRSWAKSTAEEGCLSLPDIFGDVSRFKRITCQYTDISGNQKIIQASNMLARVIQHELDHLDGILFIDKAKNIQKIKPERS